MTDVNVNAEISLSPKGLPEIQAKQLSCRCAHQTQQFGVHKAECGEEETRNLHISHIHCMLVNMYHCCACRHAQCRHTPTTEVC